jgi:hypothetical protein
MLLRLISSPKAWLLINIGIGIVMQLVKFRLLPFKLRLRQNYKTIDGIMTTAGVFLLVSHAAKLGKLYGRSIDDTFLVLSKTPPESLPSLFNFKKRGAETGSFLRLDG